jgi:hypothetical protein
MGQNEWNHANSVLKQDLQEITIYGRINILVNKGKHFLTWLKYNESIIQRVQIIQAFSKRPLWRFEKIICTLLTLLIFFISLF